MTKLFTWTKENSVGVAEIDVQHQHIFAIINNLADSIDKNKAQEEIDQVLSELVDYSKIHFGVEEHYFKQFNYINSADHISKHHYFVNKVFEFYDLKEDPKVRGNLPYEIIAFLKEWWLYHINVEDKKYTKVFHQHGLF